MRVVWVESIVDRIKKVREDAFRNAREVDYILLNKQEWDEFIAYCRSISYGRWIAEELTECQFMGIRVKRYDYK